MCWPRQPAPAMHLRHKSQVPHAVIRTVLATNASGMCVFRSPSVVWSSSCYRDIIKLYVHHVTLSMNAIISLAGANQASAHVKHAVLSVSVATMVL